MLCFCYLRMDKERKLLLVYLLLLFNSYHYPFFERWNFNLFYLYILFIKSFNSFYFFHLHLTQTNNTEYVLVFFLSSSNFYFLMLPIFFNCSGFSKVLLYHILYTIFQIIIIVIATNKSLINSWQCSVRDIKRR